MLHAKGPEISLALTTHPKTKAVGFTGSERAGRALFNAAAARPDPIPVFAEMGSVNPVFILPEALKKSGQAIAEGLFRSVLTGRRSVLHFARLGVRLERCSISALRQIP